MNFTYSFMFHANSVERQLWWPSQCRSDLKCRTASQAMWAIRKIERLQHLGKVACFVFGLQTRKRVAALASSGAVGLRRSFSAGLVFVARWIRRRWKPSTSSPHYFRISLCLFQRLTDSMPGRKFFLGPTLPRRRHRASAFHWDFGSR